MRFCLTSQKRADANESEHILEVLEMAELRKTVKQTRRDRIRSENIRKQLNTQNISSSVTKGVEWNNHIARMATNSIVKYNKSIKYILNMKYLVTVLQKQKKK